MKRSFPTLVSLLAAALSWSLAPSAADAQPTKLGFKVGEKSKLNTSLVVATAFDSNSLRRGTNPITGDDDAQGQEDVRLFVRPGLALDVPGTNASFQLGLGATISQFFGAGDTARSDTLFGLDSRLRLRLGNNKGLITFTLENDPMLTPTVLPEAGTIGADERLFPAFTNQGRAFFTLRPGGGALEFDVGHKNQYIVFTGGEATDQLDDGFYNIAFLEARWKFLPKTALALYGDFGAFDPSRTGAQAPTLESNPYTIQLGLIGQITRTVATELRAGYAETLVWSPGGGRFSELDPGNQRTVVGLASVSWQAMRTLNLSLTYHRSLQPVILLSSFIGDAVRGKVSWGIDRLVLNLHAEYQMRTFGTQRPGAESQINDPVAHLGFGGASADYYFTDWLVGGLAYRSMIQGSNDGDRTGALFLLGDFDRQQVFARVGVEY